MDISTKVNIALCVLSFILAAVSVVTVVITLRQNNRMIENSTRPYISIYFDYIQMGEPIGYLIVKNFGSSTAIIDSLTYNDVIAKHPSSLANLPAIFNGLVGSSIVPGQKFFAPFKLYEYIGGDSIFDISYHVGNKKYTDHFEISVSNYGKLVKPRLANQEYKAISYPLQEISERLM